jgi:hypothetical protein
MYVYVWSVALSHTLCVCARVGLCQMLRDLTVVGLATQVRLLRCECVRVLNVLECVHTCACACACVTLRALTLTLLRA